VTRTDKFTTLYFSTSQLFCQLTGVGNERTRLIR